VLLLSYNLWLPPFTGPFRLLCVLERLKSTSKNTTHTKIGNNKNDLDVALVQLFAGHDSTSTAPTLLSHVRQRQCWDCGIACLLMVAQWIYDGLDQEKIDHYYRYLLEQAATESVWTVDLIILLDGLLQILGKSRGKFLATTTCLSVNSAWSSLNYYRKAYRRDCMRVEQRLVQMERDNLPAIQLHRLLPLSTVVKLVQRADCIAIALVDNSVLMENIVGDDESFRFAPYSGHYVVLVGASMESDHLRMANETTRDVCLVLYNPGVDGNAPTYLSLDHFERAWRAKGTDDDIIFVTRTV
jgi:hypothetical protein